MRRRILAIDPIPRGIAYAVLESPDLLVGFGRRNVAPRNLERQEDIVQELFTEFAPEMLILEDIMLQSSRRGARMQRFITSATTAGQAAGIRVVRVPRFQETSEGHESKAAVAERLALRSPELVDLRPPKRKVWMREDERHGIFACLDFAVRAVERESTFVP